MPIASIAVDLRPHQHCFFLAVQRKTKNSLSAPAVVIRRRPSSSARGDECRHVPRLPQFADRTPIQLAERVRDNIRHEQFAMNHVSEVDHEFQRHAKESHVSGPGTAAQDVAAASNGVEAQHQDAVALKADDVVSNLLSDSRHFRPDRDLEEGD